MNYRGATVDELIQSLSNQLSELNQTSVDGNAIYNTTDLMKITLTEFSARFDNKGKFTGLNTGIKSLDDKLFGLQKAMYMYLPKDSVLAKQLSQ